MQNAEYNIEFVPPVIAAEWLQRNVTNRLPQRSRVASYAADMISGRWLFTGCPIQFDQDGNLINGQHRLMAVIKAGVTLQFLIVRNLDAAVFSVLDTGLTRSGANTLQVKRWANPKSSAAALQYIAAYRITGKFAFHQDSNGQPVRVTNELTNQTANQHADVENVVKRVLNLTKNSGLHTHKGLLAAAWFLFAEKDIESADRFMTQICSGEYITRNDPAWHMRTRLLENKSLPVRNAGGLIVKAWGFYRLRKPIKSLRFEPKTNPWPEII